MSKDESNCRFKIGWRPISIQQSDENLIMKTLKEIKISFKIEWKVSLCEHLTI